MFVPAAVKITHLRIYLRRAHTDPSYWDTRRGQIFRHHFGYLRDFHHANTPHLPAGMLTELAGLLEAIERTWSTPVSADTR